MPEQTSPLRQRMIDDMKLRNMSLLTQAAYVRAVKNFSFVGWVKARSSDVETGHNFGAPLLTTFDTEMVGKSARYRAHGQGLSRRFCPPYKPITARGCR